MGEEKRRDMLGEFWEVYRSHLVHADAGAAQVRETRKAFYLGALAVLETLIRIGEPDVSEADAVATLEGLYREAREFMETGE